MTQTTALALAVRITIALLTRTFFQPDEYFQALEPAHHAVFGYGDLTWEWLAPRPIRSIAYPALNIPIYWLLKVLRLDDTALLVICPKIIHGALAALTDVCVRELARVVVGERYADVTFILSLSSCFHGLALSRSLSNSPETSLTTAALVYFPWDAKLAAPRWKLRRLLSLAALACVFRTTNALLWIFWGPLMLWKLRAQRAACFGLITDAFVIGLSSLFALFVLDSVYYKRPTLTALSFLATNASPVSLFYGSAPWHYYLTQALPILLGTSLPFFVGGVWSVLKTRDQRSTSALVVISWSIAIYSCAGHKEWRFLHPILPLMHVIAAKYIVDAYHARIPARSHTRVAILKSHMALLSLSIPVIVYIALFHSSAQLSVMAHLRSLPDTELRSVGFLMPCHSVPGQSHLHRPPPLNVWALGCEPPLGLSAVEAREYKDQTDVFLNAPRQYLETYFPPAVDITFPPSPHPRTPAGTTETGLWAHEWPTHLVIFGALLEEEGVGEKLGAMGYVQRWRAGTGVEEDARKRGGVRVWQYVANLTAAV